MQGNSDYAIVFVFIFKIGGGEVLKIGVDAMGGDHAPYEVVKGAIQALEQSKSEIVFYGDESQIKEVLNALAYKGSKVSIIHADEAIENDDKPVAAIKSKPNSSMVLGLKALRKNEVDAFVSAGNTGALLAGSLFKVGRIKGVDRPAICTVYPTAKGISVLVDAGANAECKSIHLTQFALMGSLYAETVLGIPNPKVGLVNIGAEETKGTPLYIQAHQDLKKMPIHFVGNVEGRDIPQGDVDVIVADGFTGNIILKLTEGVAKSITQGMKHHMLKNFIGKIGALLIKNNLKDFKKQLDYTEYGGAPLLGVNGLVVKAHGSSNAKAFKNAIRYAEKGIESKIVETIHEHILVD